MIDIGSKRTEKVHIDDPLAVSSCILSLRKHLNSVINEDRQIVVLCIGTDRSTGDSLGPLIGSKLESTVKKEGIAVYGTLENPVHATNLVDTMKNIRQNYHNPYVIAIDACLGKLDNVGCITVEKGSIKPGAGVNKDLPAVGDLSITGIVNVGGFMEYFVLQSTRLSLVMKMANIISTSLLWGINNFKANTTPAASVN